MVNRSTKNVPKTLFDKLVLAVAIVEPLTMVPQIYQTYKTQDASSLSLLSWLLFASAAFIWLIYGIKINSRPLIISSFLWIVTELLLVVGIILYS